MDSVARFKNFKQFFIPRGFAHGFAVLSKEAIVAYKCDAFYSPEYELGIRYDDTDLDIDWMLPSTDIILSEKDSKFLSLRQVL